MSSRLFGCLLLIVVFAAWKLPMSSTGQELQKPSETEWEYRVHRMDGLQCATENALSEPLNKLGREGWELVGLERALPAIPKDAEGTLLLRPAATGPGREHSPQTADSFEGSIHMKMALSPPGACLLIFKRQHLSTSR